MESYLIFKVTNHLLSKVVWEKSDNYGWIYCGLLNDLKKDLLEKSIISHFEGEKVYLACSRKQSYEVNTSDAAAAVATNIDENSFSLWSQDFKKVMEFNRIGIFRKGICAANTSFI